MISIFMIFRENNCEKEITVSNVILFLQNLSRGLINIAAKLTNTKDVRDFFIDLVEKVRFSLKKKNICISKDGSLSPNTLMSVPASVCL